MFISCLLRLRLFAISRNRPSRHMSRQELSDVFVRKLCHIRSLTRRCCCCYSGKPVTVVSPSHSKICTGGFRTFDSPPLGNTQHSTQIIIFSNLRKKARAGNFVSKNPSKWGQAVWKCLHCLHPSFMMLLYNTQCSLIRFRTTRSRILKKSLRMQFRPF